MNIKKVPLETNFNFIAASQERVYGFMYENFENDVLKNQIFYELEVNFISDRYSSNCVFEINRKQLSINNKKPNSKIEKIAETAAQNIFPLRIKIKKNGEIDKILNHEAIKKRWFEAKNTILEYYKGKDIAKVISKIETMLLDKISLVQSLNENWFFHLFFKPLYDSYTENRCQKYIWKSPVFGNQFIEYDVVQTVQEQYSNDDKIKINVDGIAIDERSINEILEGFKFPKSKFSDLKANYVESNLNVDYKLYKEDRSISSVTGNFETKIDDNTTQRIQVEIYHLTDSSSYRPQDDTIEKENLRIYDSWQTVDRHKGKDNYFFDLSKEIKENPSIPTQKPIYTGKKIELFVEEVFPKKKNSFWNTIKSIFKRKNKFN